MLKNKKAVEFSTAMLMKLIFALLGAFILFGVIYIIFSDSTDIESAIALCRTSVDAREYSATKTSGSLRAAVPMLCKTIDLQIPEQKYAELAERDFKKAVMMNIADRSMDCWYMFGDGVYDRNVFSGWGFFSKNQCFACFTFTINDHPNYEPVSIAEFNDFLSEESYKPIPEFVPFCLFDQDESDGCVPRNAPECERKGGICSEISLPGMDHYDGWGCDSKKKSCYINPGMFVTYTDHLLSRAYGVFTVEGNLIGLSPEIVENTASTSILPETGFNRDQTYGIGFISHTRDIGFAVVTAVVAAGVTAAIVFSGGTAAVPITASVTTGASMLQVGGGVVTYMAVAQTTVITGTTVAAGATAGAGLKTIGAIALIGGGAGYAAEESFLSIFNRRQPPTIYLSEISDLENECNVVGDFNQ